MGLFDNFPYVNRQQLNLDWILKQVEYCVTTVKNWRGVSSVNGKGGDVILTAKDVGALPDTYQPPVKSVNSKTGNVLLTAADVGAKPESYKAPVDSVNGKTGEVTIKLDDMQGTLDGGALKAGSVKLAAIQNQGSSKNGYSLVVDANGNITTANIGGGGGGEVGVASVNGKSGVVTLAATDVGAVAESGGVAQLNQLKGSSGCYGSELPTKGNYEGRIFFLIGG